MLRIARGKVPSPVIEILEHGQAREDLASLRHQRDAEPRALIGLELLEIAPFPFDSPAGDGSEAADGAQEARLADPVAPQEAGDLAHLGGDAHVPSAWLAP